MREHVLQSIPGSRNCKCRCPEVGQRVVMLLEIRVHASWVAVTTPRTCGEVGQNGGLLSAISVLNPGMSTSYHLFLPKLLRNKMSYWHLSLNLSKTNVLLTPTCSCSSVPSIEENSYRTLSHCHNKSGSESCGFRQFSVWNIPPNHSLVFILTDC